ncbi:MAG: hypothetical protein A3F67_10665 [Verrucomicrobia bacterium RIFCSPHIGHO2_12_FULL_41_10]|nr:MAG: hypothetical protein A3F67_10665 [Verrucomicrobia bacterium RIFCSPHIGHO2_12_FULL_41_10]HLB34591.1 hypothetical protein [Chthoniobacterales bacterium]
MGEEVDFTQRYINLPAAPSRMQVAEDRILKERQATERKEPDQIVVDCNAQKKSLLRIEADQKLIEQWRAMKVENEGNRERANAAGRKEEGKSWNSAGNAFNNASEKLGKAIEAEAAGKPEVAMKWREAAEQHKNSVEPYAQAAQAASGNTKGVFSWNQIGNAFNNAADKLGKAIEAEVDGKPEIARKYCEVAEKKMCSIEPYTQAARTCAAEEKGQSGQWNNAGSGFYYAADHLGKAIEVEVAGKSEVARKYREVAEQYACSAEPFTQSARAYEQGKTAEGASWNHIGSRFYNAAGQLIRAIEADAAGKPEIARKYREVAEQQVRSVEPYAQAARARSAGKTEEGQSWNGAGIGFYNAGLNLEKAIEAEVAGRPELARKYREVAEQYTHSVEPHTQSARAYAAGKKDEGACWYSAGLGCYQVSEKLEKAIEAEVAGKLEVARKYREAAEQFALSVEPYTQSARAYTAGKKDEGQSWIRIASGFYYAAAELAKAIKAELADKPEVVQK